MSIELGGRRRSRGGAMVEFAIAVPVLLMLLVGAVEMGWAVYSYHFVESAACQAARYAMVRGADCSSWGSACPASADDIARYVRGLAPGAIDASALTATTVWTPSHTPGSEVTVTVQYDFGLTIPFVDARGLTMTSSAAMVIEQ